MITRKGYKNIFIPLCLLLVVGAVLLGVDAFRNLKSKELDISFKVDEQRNSLSLLQEVSRKKGVGGKEIQISRDVNPFTKDHQDWKEDKKKTIKNPSKLNLKVLAVLKWQGVYKVNLIDLAEKGQGGFWLKEGDFYKGYEVFYVGPYYMIFKGDGKNIRISLRDSKGQLYQGQGEVFVAPDIDSYLKELREKRKERSFFANATNSTSQNASSLNATNATNANATWNDNLDGDGGSGDAQSEGQEQGGGSASGGSSGSSSQGSQTTHEEEMQFIQEIMKIFKE